jgi:hypothetical protein
MRSSTALALASLFTSAFAALPKGSVTCGSNVYTVSQLTAAINAGLKDLNSGNLQDDYPHQYYE